MVGDRLVGYVLKQRERRSPITEMSRRSGTDTESADVEGLRRLLAAKQAEAEMYKSSVADRPLNNAAAVRMMGWSLEVPGVEV